MTKIEPYHFEQLLHEIGEDPKREGLIKTPERSAEALEFLTSGYSVDINKIVNGAIFASEEADELVLVKNISFASLCEHHILPFTGHVTVGYIPDGKVIGLSKIPRIVDMFARRLQIQERLTTEIANAVEKVITPKGVGVIVNATHSCMAIRGVQKQSATMQTSALKGVFKDKSQPETRAEFMSLALGSN